MISNLLDINPFALEFSGCYEIISYECNKASPLN